MFLSADRDIFHRQPWSLHAMNSLRRFTFLPIFFVLILAGVLVDKAWAIVWY